jgi:phosphatidylcholine synthase
MDTPGEPRNERRDGPPAVFAWLVHMFTASGAILALLALLAVEQGAWRLALLWLFVAVVVDGIDGTFARWARVKEKAGRIDGDTLDLVIDYLTYVFVPMLFLWRSGLIPETLAPWLAAGIQFSSLYLFARRDMKTPDNYFRGFPALWNVVAFYLFALGTVPTMGAIVVLFLIVATFAPVHFIHPFRVIDYGRVPPILALAWAIASPALLWLEPGSIARAVCLAVSVGSALILILMGLMRTARGPA